MRTPRLPCCFRLLAAAGPAMLLCLSACSPDPAPLPDEARLPAAAVAAFQAHLRTMSEGDLTCPAEAIEAAPRATAYLNPDREPDFAIRTQDLACRSERNAAIGYFCGGAICAFPALISNGDGYEVVWLMSGNEIEAQPFYRQDRFIVRQISYAGPRASAVLVREYAWVDGRLERVVEREEVASRRP